MCEAAVMSGHTYIHTYIHRHIHTYTHTYTHDNYNESAEVQTLSEIRIQIELVSIF